MRLPPYLFVQCSVEVNDEVAEVPNYAEAKSADGYGLGCIEVVSYSPNLSQYRIDQNHADCCHNKRVVWYLFHESLEIHRNSWAVTSIEWDSSLIIIASEKHLSLFDAEFLIVRMTYSNLSSSFLASDKLTSNFTSRVQSWVWLETGLTNDPQERRLRSLHYRGVDALQTHESTRHQMALTHRPGCWLNRHWTLYRPRHLKTLQSRSFQPRACSPLKLLYRCSC